MLAPSPVARPCVPGIIADQTSPNAKIPRSDPLFDTLNAAYSQERLQVVVERPKKEDFFLFILQFFDSRKEIGSLSLQRDFILSSTVASSEFNELIRRIQELTQPIIERCIDKIIQTFPADVEKEDPSLQEAIYQKVQSGIRQTRF